MSLVTEAEDSWPKSKGLGSTNLGANIDTRNNPHKVEENGKVQKFSLQTFCS